MIQLKNVTKQYGESGLAVDGLSFDIAEGETFGLIGTSGCGKTTTLKMINRLIDPTSGTISVDGQDVSLQDPQTLRRNIGYVIQNMGLFPHYNVQENISIVPKLLKWNPDRIQSRTEELLQLVGLNPAEFSKRKPDELSGGQQQRVGLARALAADPPVILMDEPFGALDPITKRQIRQEVSQIFQEIKKTLVLVTHDVFEAVELCDRLCLLDKGKMQQIGTPKELLFQPENRFVRSFFASNRFQLELLSVKVEDILAPGQDTKWYWSSPIKISDHQEDIEKEIDETSSLNTILEEMEKAGDENMVINKCVNGKVKESLSFADLLNRFQQCKTQWKEGVTNG